MSPIFIVGVGRSGTSLLQSMLASHSELSFLPETAFIRKYIVKNKLEKIASNSGVESVLNEIAKDTVLSRVNFDFIKCFDNQKVITDLNLYEAMQLEGVTSQGKVRYGDKDPRLIEYLPTLKRNFPEAYVINIIRDPRDVLSSKKKAAWSAGRTTMFYAFANRVQLKMAKLFGTKLFGDKYIEIYYEDLIKDPETYLKTLCSKINLTYEANLLEFGQQAKKLVSKSEESWKKETFGPLLTDNSDKWKKQLNVQEVALTELSCADVFNIGRYKKSGSFGKLSLISKIATCLSLTVIVSITPLYILFRRNSQKGPSS